MVLPLEGIKVLECAGFPGAWATGVLGDFGADVIKVIRAPLPPLRFGMKGMVATGSPEEQMKNAAFNSYDRNKRSIALDLQNRDAREVYYRAVEKSDVVVEGYRPGVAARLGIDYDKLRKINPRIIYCAISGYGQDGPYRDLAGHDINYVSIGGALHLTGRRNGPPIMLGAQVGDLGGGGSQVVMATLLALMARERTGEGQFIDLSMTDGVISWMADYASDYFVQGFLPGRGTTAVTGAAPWNNVYQTRDKKYISIACVEPRLYENLCRALGRDDLIPHRQGKGQAKVFSAFRKVFLTRTRDEWFLSLKEKGVGVAPVYSFDEVFRDPQVLHRKMLVELEHPTLGRVKQIGISMKLSGTPGKIRSLAPLPGQDTERVLQELGYSRAHIDRLRREGGIV